MNTDDARLSPLDSRRIVGYFLKAERKFRKQKLSPDDVTTIGYLVNQIMDDLYPYLRGADQRRITESDVHR